MEFSAYILRWYSQNCRSLPWRGSTDPYIIWISEIILQQTRVDQGKPYFERFIEKFPDVISLSLSSEQEVLNLWKGLGYYSRARNIHFAANQVLNDYGGIFPKSFQDLIKLKGIGIYTAAAISSICNNEVVPAIDGNVIRVVSRYFGITEENRPKQIKIVNEILINLITTQKPGDFNQAMMEFGALVCKPASPLCSQCELKNSCYACLNNKTDTLPVKKARLEKKVRYFNYFHFHDSAGRVLLKKRVNNDIWNNLWEFPLVEGSGFIDHIDVDFSKIDQGIIQKPLIDSISFSGWRDVKHKLTHQLLHIRFFTYEVSFGKIEPNRLYTIVNSSDIDIPVPRVIEKFLQE